MAKVRTRTLFSDDKVTVTAVESMEFQADRSNRRRFVVGSLRPLAVIVKEAGGSCRTLPLVDDIAVDDRHEDLPVQDA